MTGRRIVPAALALAMLAVAALAVATPRLIDGTGEAQAHSGQLSPKDGCHKHKAAKERHWHVEGSATRGGECVKQDGTAYRVIEREAGPNDECEHMLKWLAAERSNSSGKFISRNEYGNPILVQADAVALVRACRGVPVPRE